MTASKDWKAFWDTQDAIDDAYWERHIAHYLEAAESVLPLGPDDVVLDIGAGSGHFALAVAPRVREIHCVETSTRYAEECAARLAGRPNAHVHLVAPGQPGGYEEFAPRFTRINCLSVIQYFDTREDFAAMLAALKRCTAPGARLLVADIRIKGTLASDLLGSLAGGLRAGIFKEKLKLLWRMLRTGYQGTRKAGLMDYPEEWLLETVRRLGLEAQFLDAPLTMNATRRHLLVHF